MKTKLNVGSGRRPKGTPDNEWEDLDFRKNIKGEQGVYDPDIVADCRQIPRPDNTYEYLYVHSVLEHFSKWEKKDCLKEWHRVLKPKGTIFISVPDMFAIGKVLVNKPNDGIINLIYGEHNYPGNEHKWGYTRESIKRDLEETGFKNIRFSPPKSYTCELIVEADK